MTAELTTTRHTPRIKSTKKGENTCDSFLTYICMATKQVLLIIM